MSDAGPNLDSLSVLDKGGHRKYVYPADAKGRWSRLKKWVYLVLIVVYVALPWIEIGGAQAVLIDIPGRRFFLFGLTFNAQDFYVAFFVLSAVGFALIVVAALWGRVWCGWACPQTVFLDGLFRRVERWIEGPAARRRRLADGPNTFDKIAKKVLKHAIYLLMSVAIAHVFLAYFVGAEKLVTMMADGPAGHGVTFAWGFVLTALIYGNFWWFREQLCIVVCPYGRLQSALQDRDTINVQYDHVRGEPRGKVSDPAAADCIDCRRCIAVCPTGIDIRNGHQLECIGCSYCIDACDEIMDKVGQPRGLIRYDSQRAVETGERRFWRPRVFAYGLAGVLGLVVATVVLTGYAPFEATLLRAQGVPYAVVDGELRNHVRLHVINKSSDETTFALEVLPPHEAHVLIPQREVTLKRFEGHDLPVVLRVPAADYRAGMEVQLRVTDRGTGVDEVVDVRVLGPPNRLAVPPKAEGDE